MVWHSWTRQYDPKRHTACFDWWPTPQNNGAATSHPINAAAREQEEYDRRVTDWEVRRGFERG